MLFAMNYSERRNVYFISTSATCCAALPFYGPFIRGLLRRYTKVDFFMPQGTLWRGITKNGDKHM